MTESPEVRHDMARLIFRGAVVETVFVVGGIGAYLATDRIMLMVGGVLIGAAFFVFMSLIPVMKLKAAARKSQGIVE